ncbi:MAG TPA: hypothetical protein VFB38_27130 [Chthonomonadaceae bacterium]|nr:hypothetical protein [Chthonomonadaceae bacterium]
MAIVCEGCGGYIQPLVDTDAQAIRCPDCGHREPMRILPLFIVTGASGAGKTAVVRELRRLLPEWEIFETDVIWGADWQQVRNNWLRIAHSIAQSGRPTLLCGMMLPEDIDRCDHRPFFRQVYYLNLHCDDPTRAARLRARPAWRGCTEAFLAEQQQFAHWLLEHAETAFDPPLRTLDTTQTPVSAVACQIRDWALERWHGEPLKSGSGGG